MATGESMGYDEEFAAMSVRQKARIFNLLVKLRRERKETASLFTGMTKRFRTTEEVCITVPHEHPLLDIVDAEAVVGTDATAGCTSHDILVSVTKPFVNNRIEEVVVAVPDAPFILDHKLPVICTEDPCLPRAGEVAAEKIATSTEPSTEEADDAVLDEQLHRDAHHTEEYLVFSSSGIDPYTSSCQDCATGFSVAHCTHYGVLDTRTEGGCLFIKSGYSSHGSPRSCSMEVLNVFANRIHSTRPRARRAGTHGSSPRRHTPGSKKYRRRAPRHVRAHRHRAACRYACERQLTADHALQRRSGRRSPRCWLHRRRRRRRHRRRLQAVPPQNQHIDDDHCYNMGPSSVTKVKASTNPSDINDATSALVYGFSKSSAGQHNIIAATSLPCNVLPSQHGIALNLFNPLCVLEDALSLLKYTVWCADWQPWPPPQSLEFLLDHTMSHPKPWPEFIRCAVILVCGFMLCSIDVAKSELWVAYCQLPNYSFILGMNSCQSVLEKLQACLLDVQSMRDDILPKPPWFSLSQQNICTDDGVQSMMVLEQLPHLVQRVDNMEKVPLDNMMECPSIIVNTTIPFGVHTIKQEVGAWSWLGIHNINPWTKEIIFRALDFLMRLFKHAVDYWIPTEVSSSNKSYMLVKSWTCLWQVIDWRSGFKLILAASVSLGGAVLHVNKMVGLLLSSWRAKQTGQHWLSIDRNELLMISAEDTAATEHKIALLNSVMQDKKKILSPSVPFWRPTKNVQFLFRCPLGGKPDLKEGGMSRTGLYYEWAGLANGKGAEVVTDIRGSSSSIQSIETEQNSRSPFVYLRPPASPLLLSLLCNL